ncbi:MAG TPA: OmpA family protein [Planctomycetaceae bacterium]|nr:OmpA family protein [Planctomycetaceae bacterium]HQZ68886.1 OmpA family protein [Planctomycetaceae bacterium]HRA88798.1 OmpA family protein [Planctomycetaceae bacterium]
MTGRSIRILLLFMPLMSLMISGCCCCDPCNYGDDSNLAKIRAQELYAENQRLMAAYDESNMLLAGANQERQALMSQLGDTETQLTTSDERLKNLMAERTELSDRYAKALSDDTILVGGGVNSALEAAGFEYDPATGLHKFYSDILFDLGSDVIRPEAGPILSEFASNAKSGAASGLRILIVGHTDDQNIVRPETAAKHPTNWHLSTDRADAVILQLQKLGVESERVAAMGYSEFHPLESSVTESARQRNRRVELFVVPNDPSLAGWDPLKATR